jgi:YidC/Oxa1 family membrane protein insertase
VFFLWQLLFVDKEPVKQTERQPKKEKIVSETPYVPEKEKTIEQAPAAAPDPAETRKMAKIITVNTPLYSVKLSEKGGVFTSYVLRNFREQAGEEAPLKEMISENVSLGTVQLGFVSKSIPGLSNAVFVSNAGSETIDVTNQLKTLVFRWRSAQGISIERQFVFSPETYLIQHSIIIRNGSGQTIKDNLSLALRNTLPDQSSRFGFEGPSALINDEVQQVKIKNIEEENIHSGNLRWIALQDRYFITSIIPSSVAESTMQLFIEPNNILKARHVWPEITINPSTQHTFEYELFFGPKSVRILKDVGRGLDKAVNFGMFDFIAKPCLWLMNFFYSIIPNYGVAIIILTMMTKILLWPLGVKSYKSMNEMKKLQPIMTEIREKHKGDKKKMNEEIMGLYRTYKINPMGGCLPMIAQIPVFFALYRMLYEAIELRHAPFFGWINDLSAPDRLFHFDFSIPFMEPPYGIPVLTLVMGATMLLQQKMTPSPGDPTQAKMMMLMPVVFTFIFINFSSGLVLYWLINNILSISQQYYITRKLA